MLLVNRWILIIALLLAAGMVLGFGVWKYSTVAASPEMTPEQIKLAAENFLFISLIGATVLLVFMAFLLGRSRRIGRELDKIVQLIRRGEYTPGSIFDRLGLLGDKLKQVFYQLEQLNEGKTRKISSLASTISFLLNNIRFPLLILDVTGTIEGRSRAFLTERDNGEEEISGRNVEDILKNINFQEIVTNLKESRQKMEVEADKTTVTFIPVFDRTYELSNVILVQTESEIYFEGGRSIIEKQGNISRLTTFIRRQINRRRHV